MRAPSLLRQNQWCATFREDLESFLQTHVKRDTISSLEDVIRIGSDSRFSMDRLTEYVHQTGRWRDPEEECGDAYDDPKRIAFRMAIENVMDSLRIDAIVYPSWNHRPARIAFFEEEYTGDNSQVISPHTGNRLCLNKQHHQTLQARRGDLFPGRSTEWIGLPYPSGCNLSNALSDSAMAFLLSGASLSFPSI